MREKFPWAKMIVGYLLYIFFHQIYDIVGSTLGALLGEGIESIYAHMKMLFYAYLILSAFDYFMFRRKGDVPVSFFYSRMLILSAVPWMMIIIYYAVQTVGIILPHAVDLTWALIVTAFGLYFSIRLEDSLDGMELRPALKGMIVLAFVSALVTYIGFSFHVPDNFFIAPE